VGAGTLGTEGSRGHSGPLVYSDVYDTITEKHPNER